jgi:ankyrin repeat protein
VCQNGETALMMACADKSASIVQALIQAGADVNVQSKVSGHLFSKLNGYTHTPALGNGTNQMLCVDNYYSAILLRYLSVTPECLR